MGPPSRRPARSSPPSSPGHFDKEIIPVHIPEHKETDRDGNEVHVPATVVTHDDGPRPGTTVEKLAALKPAFKEDGTVTAGNACPLNDGAAALLLMSDERASGARDEAARAHHRLHGVGRSAPR